jgi:hypothetical protein
VGVRTYEPREEPRPVRRSPSAGATTVVSGLVLFGLLANGRPIGMGDAAPLPAVAGAAAAPILAASRAVFAQDAAGAALAGKLAASFFGALAAGLLFQAVGRRRPTDDAWTTALLFAFSTTVWASAQWLSAVPISTALVATGVLLLVLSEDDPKWAPRAGLPLSLAFAANPADLGLVSVLAFSVLMRSPRQMGLWALWGAPGMALAVAGAGGDLGRLLPSFGPEWADRLPALFVGPADGVFLFAPVVVFLALPGLARSLRGDDAPLATGCAAAFLVHGVFIAGQPAQSGVFGPRDWTDAMPLVLLFLPEGLDVVKGLGVALATVSVGVQALGAFSYDIRWDRLMAPTAERRRAATWDFPRSPVPFQVGERVLILALPRLDDGKVRIHEHRVVPFAPRGSRVSAGGSRLLVEGSDATLGNVHLQGAARVEAGKIRLQSPGDALFARVVPESRARRLELRVSGRGRGTLLVNETSFWSVLPKSEERPVNGEFRLKLPYYYPESGGGDLTVSLAAGSIELVSLSLVPPTEPENVIRLGPSGKR